MNLDACPVLGEETSEEEQEQAEEDGKGEGRGICDARRPSCVGGEAGVRLSEKCCSALRLPGLVSMRLLRGQEGALLSATVSMLPVEVV